MSQIVKLAAAAMLSYAAMRSAGEGLLTLRRRHHAGEATGLAAWTSAIAIAGALAILLIAGWLLAALWLPAVADAALHDRFVALGVAAGVAAWTAHAAFGDPERWPVPAEVTGAVSAAVEAALASVSRADAPRAPAPPGERHARAHP